MPEDRVIEVGRLRVEDVERRAGQRAVLDPGQHGVQALHHAAARQVDQERARFHGRDPAAVDHAAGLIGERRVQAHGVGAPEQRVELHQLDVQPPGRGRVGVRVVRQQRDPERTEQPGERLADVAEADDADGEPGDVASRKPLPRRPVALLHLPVPVGDPLVERQQIGDRRLGHRGRVGAGRGDHRHPALGGGVHVDRVVADPGAADDAQPARVPYQAARRAGRPAQDDADHLVVDRRLQRRLRVVGGEFDRSVRRQGPVGHLRDRRGGDEPRHRYLPPRFRYGARASSAVCAPLAT